MDKKVELELFVKCTNCNGTGLTKHYRCHAITKGFRPHQCKSPAKQGSPFCGLHQTKEEKEKSMSKKVRRELLILADTLANNPEARRKFLSDVKVRFNQELKA
jgi:hypothetical protein